MSFAVPAALLLSAFALPIIALYILKVRLRRVPVSTNLFWKQVFEEKPPRSLWQQLRHWLSLLAQLLLLLLLVLAVADPVFPWQTRQARRLVIILDTSASMRADDVAPSRFEAARTAAQKVLDGSSFRDQVAIVSAGHRPEVVLGMASHVPTLRRALESLAPTDSSASLDAAIALAHQLIGRHPRGEILVLTDGCAERQSSTQQVGNLVQPIGDPNAVTSPDATASPGAAASPDAAADADIAADATAADPGSATANAADDDSAGEPDSRTRVQYHRFGTAAQNVGIVQFQARRSLVDPLGYEVLVSVRNASPAPAQGRLELELDEIPVDVIPFQLQPDETWTRTVEKTSLEGGILKASLTQLSSESAGPASSRDSSADQTSAKTSQNASRPSDAADAPHVTHGNNGLQSDDIAWAVISPRHVQDVLIVSPGNLFLERVFEANPLVNLQVRADLPTEWPDETIVVLHQLVPETLPTGKVLVIDPETSTDQWKVLGAIENPIVTQQDDQSPLMTHIRLDNVLMPDARRLEFAGPVHVLAETVTGDAIYADLQRPQGQALVLSINLERSDLAFRTAFPILIANSLNWFAGEPEEFQASFSGGQMASLTGRSTPIQRSDDPAGDASSNTAVAAQHELTLISPSGRRTPLFSEQIGPLNEIGVWQVVQTTSPGTTESASVNNTLDDTLDNTLSDTADVVIQQIAVNLASSLESDLRPDESLLETTSETPMTANWLTRPLWYYLVIAACAFSMLEWFLYQRRLIT